MREPHLYQRRRIIREARLPSKVHRIDPGIWLSDPMDRLRLAHAVSRGRRRAALVGFAPARSLRRCWRGAAEGHARAYIGSIRRFLTTEPKIDSVLPAGGLVQIV